MSQGGWGSTGEEPKAGTEAAWWGRRDEVVENGKRRIAVVTGTRAEFGLLKPVMAAIAAHEGLELQVIAAGAHMLGTQPTYYEVKRAFAIAEVVPMQTPGQRTRLEDAEAVGRGMMRFARAYARLRPHWVLVLGDRIEAFAAASSAAIAGLAVAHMHGGDRAEGVADESMRHAITKLAHLHLAATEESAARIVRMGERPEMVHVVGSPAVDGLLGVAAMDDAKFDELGGPRAVVLMHPIGRDEAAEEADAAAVLGAAVEAVGKDRVLALAPNYDPGRDGVVRAIEASGVRSVDHLPREEFAGLLRTLAARGGVLMGNSSAGLIEAAVLGVPVVDIGPRQAGRERCANVVHAEAGDRAGILDAARAGLALRGPFAHPYGDGRAGERAAALLAATDPLQSGLIRKRNMY